MVVVVVVVHLGSGISICHHSTHPILSREATSLLCGTHSHTRVCRQALYMFLSYVSPGNNKTTAAPGSAAASTWEGDEKS